jgi:DNA-binding NarL/FixJ family response regulator
MNNGMNRGSGSSVKRLLIVADQSFVVPKIRLALCQTGDLRVIGLLDGRASVRARLLDVLPDVVLVADMQNPDDTLGRLREIGDVIPESRTLLLTQRLDDEWIEAAFQAGAETVVSSTVSPLALAALLRETVRGNIIHPHRRAPARNRACPLTSRELEILELASGGRTNREIGRDLWITEQTVKFHLSNTYRKLGVSNRTEASRYAHVHALVTPERERLAS